MTAASNSRGERRVGRDTVGLTLKQPLAELRRITDLIVIQVVIRCFRNAGRSSQLQKELPFVPPNLVPGLTGYQYSGRRLVEAEIIDNLQDCLVGVLDSQLVTTGGMVPSVKISRVAE
jgi:hypothetical protein